MTPKTSLTGDFFLESSCCKLLFLKHIPGRGSLVKNFQWVPAG